MLVGSAPVVLVITPSVLLGACQLMVNRDGWDAAARVATLVAVLVQGGALLGFASALLGVTGTLLGITGALLGIFEIAPKALGTILQYSEIIGTGIGAG